MTDAAPTSKLAFWKTPGFGLSLVYFFLYGVGGTWSPLLNVYLQQMGLTGTQIGAISAIRPAIGLVTRPLWGIVADMWGRRRMVLILLPIEACLLLGYVWGGDGSFLFFLALGCVYTVISSPVMALIDSLSLDHIDRHPGLTFGQLRLWGSAGFALAALGIGALIKNWNLRPVFLGAAFALTACCVLAWAALPRAVGKKADRRSWRGAAGILRNRNFLFFMIITLLLHLGTSPMNQFYGIYLKELGAPASLMGLGTFLRASAEIPMMMAAGAVIRRMTPRWALIIAMGFYATQAFLYSFNTNPWVASLGETLRGPSFGLQLVVSVHFVSSQVPAEWRATGQTLYSAISGGLGSIMAGAWGGVLYDRVGIHSMYRVCGYLIVGLILLTLVLLRDVKTPVVAPAQHAER